MHAQHGAATDKPPCLSDQPREILILQPSVQYESLVKTEMADGRYSVSHVASIKTGTLGESWENDIRWGRDQAFGFVPRDFFRLGSIAEHQSRHSNDVAVGCEGT